MTIIIGGIVGYFTGPYLKNGMTMLGTFIREATELQPFIMGIVVSVVMGIILTLPIRNSSRCVYGRLCSSDGWICSNKF